MALGPLREATDFLFSTMKKKGCEALMTFADSEETIPVFLGGVGAALFSRDEHNQPESVEQVLSASTVRMEWVFNRFYGRHEEFGEMVVDFKTGGEDGLQSQLVIIADGDSGLLPGTMINILYFQIHLPGLGLTLFNRDPLVLRSQTTNVSARYFDRSPAYEKDPESFPERYRQLAEPDAPAVFSPVGTHGQVSRLPLYTDGREEPVAWMEGANVTVGLHHGLDAVLLASDSDDESLTATIALRNLTLVPHEVRWDASAVNNLDVVSEPSGVVELPPRDQGDQAEIELVATRRDRARDLGRMDCVLVGATNLGQRYEDLVSAMIVLNAPAEAEE